MDEEIDLAAELAAHLPPQEIAVLIETGSEKLRYLVGEAIAVGPAGEIASVSLDSIYDLALENAPDGASVSEAAY